MAILRCKPFARIAAPGTINLEINLVFGLYRFDVSKGFREVMQRNILAPALS